MNLFIFTAYDRDGTIHSGIFEASDGREARDMLPTLLEAAKINYSRFDFRGVDSKRFCVLSSDIFKSLYATQPQNGD